MTTASTAARLEALEHAESASSFCVFEFEEVDPAAPRGKPGKGKGESPGKSRRTRPSARRSSSHRSLKKGGAQNEPPKPVSTAVAAMATQPVTKTKRKMRGARALPEPLEEPASLNQSEDTLAKAPSDGKGTMNRDDISLTGIRSEIGSEFNSQGLWTGDLSILTKAPSVSQKGNTLSKTMSGPAKAVASARGRKKQMKDKGREEMSKLAGATGSEHPSVMMAEIELLHHIMQREQTLQSLREVVDNLDVEYLQYVRKCRGIAILDRKRKLGLSKEADTDATGDTSSPNKKRQGGVVANRRGSTRDLVQVGSSSHPDNNQFQEVCELEDAVRSKQRMATFLIQNARENSLLVITSHQRWRAQLQSLLAKTKRASKAHTVQPFLYEGLPYLMKMKSDLDFLERSSTMKQWLGFTIEKNPMLIPAVPWTSYQPASVLPHDEICDFVQGRLESIASRRIAKRNEEEGRNLRLRINGIVRSMDTAATAENNKGEADNSTQSSHFMEQEEFGTLVDESAHQPDPVASASFVSSVLYNFVIGQALQNLLPKDEAMTVYTKVVGSPTPEIAGDGEEDQTDEGDVDDDDVLSEMAEEELDLPMIIPDMPLVDHLDDEIVQACAIGVTILENEQRLHRHIQNERKKEEFDMKHGYDPFVGICEFESLDQIFQTYMEKQPDEKLETVKQGLLSRQQGVNRLDENEEVVDDASAKTADGVFITESEGRGGSVKTQNRSIASQPMKFNKKRVKDRVRDEDTSRRVMVTRERNRSGGLQGSAIVRKKPPTMSRLMILQRRKDAATHIQSIARAKTSRKAYEIEQEKKRRVLQQEAMQLSALALQRCLRGRTGRETANIKREAAGRAKLHKESATKIQRVFRGALGRWDAEMEARWQSQASLGEVLSINASSIQVEEYRKRGEARRKQLAEQRKKGAERYAMYEKQWLVKERKRQDAATTCQSVVRGFLGRRQAMWKRHLLQAEEEQVIA
jgi:hypothetical protein